jgi:hypothetical protein
MELLFIRRYATYDADESYLRLSDSGFWNDADRFLQADERAFRSGYARQRKRAARDQVLGKSEQRGPVLTGTGLRGGNTFKRCRNAPSSDPPRHVSDQRDEEKHNEDEE